MKQQKEQNLQMKKVIELKKQLNDKLQEIGEMNSAFSIGLIKHLIAKYKDDDWENYEKETGNKKPHFEIKKTHVKEFVNQKTGLSPEIDERNVKFMIWVVEGFMKGVEERQEKEIIGALSL